MEMLACDCLIAFETIITFFLVDAMSTAFKVLNQTGLTLV